MVVEATEIASMYNFTNRTSLACGMIPNERMESLRALRFRMVLGEESASTLEIVRAG